MSGTGFCSGLGAIFCGVVGTESGSPSVWDDFERVAFFWTGASATAGGGGGGMYGLGSWILIGSGTIGAAPYRCNGTPERHQIFGITE